MNRKLILVSAAALLLTLTLFNSCKKEDAKEPLEPIALLKPDTSVLRLFPGDALPLEVKFTTDRPINWIKGMVDLDTTLAAYTPTYPDTLFFVALDTLDPRVNRYTYTGSFLIADTLQPFSVLRLKISFEAGKNSFTAGQNYPPGIVSASKEFRIDVR